MYEMPISSPIVFDETKCNGCNQCLEVCQVDILLPNTVKGKPPIVAFPGECWYCGCCVMECSQKDAISLRHPLMNQVRWINKKKLIEK